MLSRKPIPKITLKLLPLLFLGLTLIISGTYHFYSRRVLSFNYSPPAISEPAKPTSISRIRIDHLGVDLEVTEAKIVNGVWEISETGASHLTSSARPGEGGNIIIYAHNKMNFFGPLVNIKPDEEVVINTNNNQEFVYRVTQTQIVSPRFIGPVLPKDEEVLTLYTCTGLLDSQRFIISAKPASK